MQWPPTIRIDLIASNGKDNLEILRKKICVFCLYIGFFFNFLTHVMGYLRKQHEKKRNKIKSRLTKSNKEYI